MKKFSPTKVSFSQKSFIAMYWLLLIVIISQLGPLATQSQGDFLLTHNDELTVNTYHSAGTLYNTSQVLIVSPGYVGNIYAHDSSTVNMSGGEIYNLEVFNSSTSNISDGSIYKLQVFNSSISNISGENVSNRIIASDLSVVNISGGNISELWTYFSSVANISGGSISQLRTNEETIVKFYGQNFNFGSGLSLDGNRVLGTGVLGGEWLNGTPWSMDIIYNGPSSTILVVPEPATLLLFGLGAVILRRKR